MYNDKNYTFLKIKNQIFCINITLNFQIILGILLLCKTTSVNVY